MDGVRWPLRLLFPLNQSDPTSLAEVHSLLKHSSSPSDSQTPAPDIIIGWDALGSTAEIAEIFIILKSSEIGPIMLGC